MAARAALLSRSRGQRASLLAEQTDKGISIDRSKPLPFADLDSTFSDRMRMRREWRVESGKVEAGAGSALSALL
jgi:hypothetical protein